jgi:hypothetical protein
MGVRNNNSTPYVHSDEPNLLNLHKAMLYNPAGEPTIRVKDAQAGYTSKNRLKVSAYQTVFFNTFQYGLETDVWDSGLTNGATATHDPNSNTVIMAVTSTLGSKCVRQTRNVMRYIPGRSSTLTYAIRFEMPVTGIRRRLGLFNDLDGFYFEDSGVLDSNGLPQYAVVIRSSVSGVMQETRVVRADWNGDKLDGTGGSGIVADPRAQHMVNFEYEWYGVGQIIVSWVIDGFSHTIHTFNFANRLQGPWCSTPFLPIRLELENLTGGQTGSHYMWQGSNSLISEGVAEKLGIAQNIGSPISGTKMTDANAYYPMLSIRLKSTALKGIVLPTFFQVATVDNTTVFYKLVRNATIGTGGSTWTDMPDSNSFCQYQTYTTPSAIALNNQGNSIDSGFVSTGGGGTGIRLDKDTVYQLGRTSLGTVSDTLTLLCAASNTNKDAIAAMTWIEQR